MVFVVGVIVFAILVIGRLTVLTFKVRKQSRQIMTYKIEREEDRLLILKLSSKVDHLRTILNHGKKGKTKKDQAEEESGDGQHEPQ